MKQFIVKRYREVRERIRDFIADVFAPVEGELYSSKPDPRIVERQAEAAQFHKEHVERMVARMAWEMRTKRI